MRFALFLASLGRSYGWLKGSLTDLRAQLVDPFFRQITFG
jgi:hypothetical protein